LIQNEEINLTFFKSNISILVVIFVKSKPKISNPYEYILPCENEEIHNRNYKVVHRNYSLRQRRIFWF